MKAVCGRDVHKDSIDLCILHPDGALFPDFDYASPIFHYYFC